MLMQARGQPPPKRKLPPSADLTAAAGRLKKEELPNTTRPVPPPQGDLFGTIARPTRAEVKRQKVAALIAWEQRHLELWFDLPGDSMERLIADIERHQPGTKPADKMGLSGEVYAPVMSAWEAGRITNPAFMIAVHRAMQLLAITRPWRWRS